MEHVGVGARQAGRQSRRVATQRDQVLVHLPRAGVGGGLGPVHRVVGVPAAVFQQLLAHEKHRNARAGEHHARCQGAALARLQATRRGGADRARQSQLPAGQGHLVVALGVDHALRGAAVVGVRHGVAHGVHVATAVAAGRHHAADRVHEPVPLAVEARAALRHGPRDGGAVIEVFGDRDLARPGRIDVVVARLQQTPSAWNVGARRVRAPHELGGIPSQAIHAEFAQPHGRVVAHVLLHLGARVVGAGAPRRVRAQRVVEEEDAAVAVLAPPVVLPHAEVVGAVVVVHHVGQHGDAARMAGVHELLQLVRAAIGAFHAEGVAGVVAPADVAREFRHRQQLDAVDAKVHQVIQLLRGAAEVAGHTRAAGHMERAQVQFIDDQPVPVGGAEGAGRPRIGRRIVHDAVAHAVHQQARSRIGLLLVAAVDLDGELVLRGEGAVAHVARPVAVAFAAQLVRRGAPEVEAAHHAHGLRVRRPGSEGDALRGAHLIRNRAHARACGHGQHHRPRLHAECQRSKGAEAVCDMGSAVHVALDRFSCRSSRTRAG